eukprot:CAMPEP_0181044360 /NCGR_PEP_ID=MMETSP1070-20121207/13222_1 /TAXON_ID=265543 /ORGANISM="Minutocellus polymorphus, Strain NH13" /LENGTH=135 /DNA_ID=CAMNT_0023122795 /DNA_START=221 /DNA_END=628 /DNA_ORIENTATION=-
MAFSIHNTTHSHRIIQEEPMPSSSDDNGPNDGANKSASVRIGTWRYGYCPPKRYRKMRTDELEWSTTASSVVSSNTDKDDMLSVRSTLIGVTKRCPARAAKAVVALLEDDNNIILKPHLVKALGVATQPKKDNDL